MSTPALQRDRGTWERLSATVRPEGRAFIAGRPVAARDGRVFDDVSPIDGQVLCQVARCRSVMSTKQLIAPAISPHSFFNTRILTMTVTREPSGLSI